MNNLRLNVCSKKSAVVSGDSHELSDVTFANDEYLQEEAFKKINRSHNSSCSP